jgi:hypothetical protein
MAKKKTFPKKRSIHLKKLNFLIGKWHTQGEILQGASDSSKDIRGMDTYEWISGEFFILHRVDVFIGNDRTEAVEIIGYDESRKSYFMQSFDKQGDSITMFAVLEKSGVLKFGDNKMKATLRINKNRSSMSAKWELAENGKTWKPWMNIQFHK